MANPCKGFLPASCKTQEDLHPTHFATHQTQIRHFYASRLFARNFQFLSMLRDDPVHPSSLRSIKSITRGSDSGQFLRDPEFVGDNHDHWSHQGYRIHQEGKPSPCKGTRLHWWCKGNLGTEVERSTDWARKRSVDKNCLSPNPLWFRIDDWVDISQVTKPNLHLQYKHLGNLGISIYVHIYIDIIFWLEYRSYEI